MMVNKGVFLLVFHLSLVLWRTSAQQNTLLPYGTENDDVMLTNGDDENVEVELQESFMFWDRNIKTFYISFNGGVMSTQYIRIASSDPWWIFPQYSILPFWEDFIIEPNKGGSVYYNTNVSRNVLDQIENLVKRNSHLGLNGEDEGVGQFEADVRRTLLVTFEKVKHISDTNVANSFQVVLTSNQDASESYIVFLYKHLDAAKVFHPKAGYFINKNNLCKLPGSDELQALSLSCKTNIYQPGVFVVGLTPKSSMLCSKGGVESSCSHCNYDTTIPEETCSSSQNTRLAVCGTNGVTYENICALKKEICKRNGSLAFSKDGSSCNADICPDSEPCSNLNDTFCNKASISDSCQRKCDVCFPEDKGCVAKNGGCEDLCIQNATSPLSRTCKCFNSKLNADGETCETRTAYFSYKNTLATTSGQTRTFPSVTRVLGVDHDADKKNIFWIGVDPTSGTNLNMAPFDDFEKSQIILKTETHFSDLTFDSTTSDIYLTEELEGKVAVIRDIYNRTGNGLKKEELMSGLRQPRAIVFEPCERLLFISDYKFPAIIQFNLTDRSSKRIVTDRLSQPNALALDVNSKKIYWGDSDIDKIERSNYDGTCREVVYFTDWNNDDEDDSHIYSMTYNSNNLYWTDLLENPADGKFHINQVDLQTGVVSSLTVVPDAPRAVGFLKYNKYHCSSKDQSQCSRLSPPSPEPITNEICYEYGDLIGQKLPRGDDVIEGEIKLERNISVLKGNIDKMFVNVNGYITLGGDIEDYELTLPYTEPVLAVSATDYNTEQAGNIYYQVTKSAKVMEKVAKDVNEFYGTHNSFRPDHVVIVTWENVPSVANPNKRNTFQAVIASDSQQTFAIYCYQRLQSEPVIGFYDGDKCTVQWKETDPGKIVARKKMVYNLTPNECNKNLTQKLNGLLPYGEGKGDTKEEIDSISNNITLTLSRQTMFLTQLTNKITITKDGRIYGPITDDEKYVSVYSSNWVKGNVFYRQSTHPQDFNQIISDLTQYVGHQNLKSIQFQVIFIITFEEVSTQQNPSQTNTFQFAHISNDEISYGLFKFQKLLTQSATSGYFDGPCNQAFLPHSTTPKSILLQEESNIQKPGTFTFLLSGSDCDKKSNNFTIIQQKIYFKSIFGSATIDFTHQESASQKSISINDVISGKEPILAIIANQNNTSMKFSYLSLHHSENSHNYTFNMLNIPASTPKTPYLDFGELPMSSLGSNTKCIKHHHFTSKMSGTPVIKVSLHHKDLGSIDSIHLKDVASAWLRNVDQSGFDVCVRKAVSLTGAANFVVSYVAVANTIGDQGFTESKVETVNSLPQTNKEEGGNKHCGIFKYKYTYHTQPLVFVTAEDSTADASSSHQHDASSHLEGTSNYQVHAWVRSVYQDHAVICGRSSSDDSDKIKIHVLITGSFDACSIHKCPENKECRIDSRTNRPSCQCITSCPEESKDRGLFCASNYKSYASSCEMYKDACALYGLDIFENVVKIHDGFCTHLPYYSGSTQLSEVPEMHGAFCQYIALPSSYFNTFSKVNVILTTHWSEQNMTSSHENEASARWSEDVTRQGFRACAMVAGRGASNRAPWVNWVAYQSNELTYSTHHQIEAGDVIMPTWYTGSRCKSIVLKGLKKSSSEQPRIMVSVEHQQPRAFRNAMTAWIEQHARNNGSTEYRICARELQNFDGVHRDIKVNWLAVYNPYPVHISEIGTVDFMASPTTPVNGQYSITARCKAIEYNSGYPSTAHPLIIVSPQNTTSPTLFNTGYSNQDTVAWVEGNNETRMKVCLKSIRSGLQQESYSIAFTVFPRKGLCEKGWYFYEEKCYSTLNAEPQSFGEASRVCENTGSSLVEIESVQENHFVSSIVAENKNIWLGYIDVTIEGDWTWLSKTPNNKYTNWNIGKPSGSTEENCALMLGDGRWDDVSCSVKNLFVCEKDSSELQRACSKYCQNGASCKLLKNDVTGNVNVQCKCAIGFAGEKCEIDLSQHKECTQYQSLENQRWRLVSNDNNNVTKQPDTACDRSLVSQTKWYRFIGASGFRLLDGDTCTNTMNQCGVRYPGWIRGIHPTVYEGVLSMRVHFYSAYCASDQGVVRVRNCGSYFVYNFVKFPYWSCEYGLCTKL
eukprot:TCONS_00060002-protein